MGYSDSDSMVRVDRFKRSGKWYDSFALAMSRVYHVPLTDDAVAEAIVKQTGCPLNKHMMYVVLEPYHQHPHPVMLLSHMEADDG